MGAWRGIRPRSRSCWTGSLGWKGNWPGGTASWRPRISASRNSSESSKSWGGAGSGKRPRSRRARRPWIRSDPAASRVRDTGAKHCRSVPGGWTRRSAWDAPCGAAIATGGFGSTGQAVSTCWIWRIGGWPAWLWAYVTPRATVYAIERGRGYAEASAILGEDYSGVIGADGWAAYRRFQQAQHQTCLAHLLRRCREMIEISWGAGLTFPRRVSALLHDALDLRDRYVCGEVSRHGARVARGFLRRRLDALLERHFTSGSNRRLAAHLRRNRDALFLFVDRKNVEATNWPAEHAIRPAVVNRKVWGGNRTATGARAQAILMSIFRTCQQRMVDPFLVFARMLRSPVPRPQPLTH